jgi:hypothetical protein
MACALDCQHVGLAEVSVVFTSLFAKVRGRG